MNDLRVCGRGRSSHSILSDIAYKEEPDYQTAAGKVEEAIEMEVI